MGFTALAGLTRAMTNKVNIPRMIRYKSYGKMSKTATKLDSLVILEVNGVKKMRVEHYAKKKQLWVKLL